MAKQGKKKRFELDDFNFDPDLEIPLLDSMPSKPKKGDRSPVVEAGADFASGLAEGARDTIATEAFIRKMVKEALPKGYGEILDLSDQTATSIKELYNTAGKEIRPLMDDLRRTTARILPKIKKYTPSKAYAELEKFANDLKRSGSEMDYDPRDYMLKATLEEVFGRQEHLEKERNAQEDAVDQLHEAAEQIRHRDSITQLDAIRLGISQLANYQINVGTNYQRKTLELGYRQYFATVDTLEEIRKSNIILKDNLVDIRKNTGLPDYVKQTPTERMAEVMRNSFIDSINEGFFDKRREFVKDVAKNFAGSMKERLLSAVSTGQSALAGANMALDASEMAQDMPTSPYRTAGGFGGEILGSIAGSKAGKWIKSKTVDNEALQRSGNKLSYFVDQFPALAKEWGQSDKGLGFGSLADFFVGSAKDAVNRSGELKKSLQMENLGTLQAPATFTNQVRKSITEIIPGLLARQLRELQIIRTGDANIGLTTYDYTRNTFEDQNSLKKNVFNSLVSNSSKQSLQYDADAIVDLVDPNKTLSKEARQLLAKQLLKDNINNKSASPDRLKDFTTFRGASSKYAQQYSELFTELFDGDPRAKNLAEFSSSYAKFGNAVTDKRKDIQDMVNAGLLNELKEMGFVTKNGSIDIERLFDYHLDDTEYTPQSQTKKDSRAQAMKVRRQYLARNNQPEIEPTQFAQPTNTPAEVKPQPVNVTVNTDNKDMIQAIRDISTVDTTKLMSDTLLRIEEQVKKGIPTYAEQGPAPQGRSKNPWWNPSIGDLAGNVLSMGGSAVSGLWNAQKWTNRQFGKIAGIASNVGMAGITKVKDRISGIRDVWVEGETEPRLLAWKMKAGHYRDQKTGKPISSWRQIKGPLVDDQGNVVLEAESVEHIYVKDGIVKKAVKIAGAGANFGMSLLQAGTRILPPIYQFAFKALGAVKEGLGMALDGPADVYVKGERSPRLLAVVMRHGGYFSERTRQPVTKISEIDGPVADSKGNILLSHDDIAKGLLDKYGKPLRHGIAKLAGLAGDATRFAANAIGSMFRFGAETAGTVFKLGGKVLKGGLGALIGEDGLVFAGSKKMTSTLEEIRDILDSRLPASKRISGDSDGDGVREGSIEDLRRKRAAAAEAKAKLASGKGEASGFGLGGLKSLYSKFFGKKDDEEKEDEDDSSLLEDAGNVADIADALNGDGGDKSSKGKKAKTPKAPKKAGLFSRAKGAIGRGASKLGGMVPKIGLGTLARGAGLAGAGLAGYSAYQNIKEGNYGAAAVDAGLGVGTAALSTGTMGALLSGGASAAVTGTGALLSGAAAVGTVIGGIIASPAFLIGAGLVGIGALGYYGYKRLTRNKLSPFERLRFAQYGFLPDGIEHAQQLRDLEEALKPGVSFNGEIATISEKKIDLKKLIEIFDVNLNDREHLDRWVRWFSNRFKPVFLTSVSAVNKAKKGSWLTDLDDNKLSVAEKKAYLNIAKFLEGPYNEVTWPFDGEGELKATKVAVEAEVKSLEQMLAKEAQKPATKTSATMATGGMAAVTTAGGVAGMASVPGSPKTPPAKTSLAATQSTRPNLATINTLGLGSSYAMITVSANGTFDEAYNGRLSAITAIRFKTYGLKEMEADRIRAIARLEKLVLKGVKFNNKKVAEWTGSTEIVLSEAGPAFGVDGVQNNNALAWMHWFTNRFLPTYLNYVTAVYKFTGKSDPELGVVTLKPQQSLDVAIAVYTSSSNIVGKNASVWTQSTSPWEGYTLNDDVKSTDPNVQAMKDAAKNSVLGDEKSTDRISDAGKRSMDAAAIRADNAKAQEKEKSWFTRTFGESGENGRPGSGVVGTVSSAYQTTKNVISQGVDNIKTFYGFGGGNEVAHPGKGTGGDINSLPMPKGSGNYAALKDLIDAASKMTGVDPRLMATMAAIESGFKWDVKASTSSATGLYQFINSTWQMMLKKYGAKYGIDPNAKPTDPRANALLGAEFLKENMRSLTGIRDRITDTDLYLAHFLGAGGAKQFLSAPQNAIAAEVMPAAARANKNIFYGTDRPRTFAEVYGYLNNLVQTKGKKFGIDRGAGSEPIVSSKPKSTTVNPTGITPPPVKPTPASIDNNPLAVEKPKTKPTATTPASGVPTPALPPSSFDGPKPKIVLPGGGYAANAAGISSSSLGTNVTPTDENTGGLKPEQRRQAKAEMAASFRAMQANNSQPKFVLEGVEAKQAETNKILMDTLNIDTQQLDVLKQLLQHVISMNKETGNRNAPSATPAPAPKPAQSMPAPTVSLSKKQFGS